MAAGGDNINAIRDDPQDEAYVLYGAAVGGPLESDKFWDYRDDWVQTEVALDYNAMIPTLAAMQVSRGSRHQKAELMTVVEPDVRSLLCSARRYYSERTRRRTMRRSITLRRRRTIRRRHRWHSHRCHRWCRHYRRLGMVVLPSLSSEPP